MCVACRANEASALEVGKVMDSKDTDAAIVVADTNSIEGSAGAAAQADGEGAAPPSTYQAMRRVLQKSVVWRALNYGMNYDIHKVRVHPMPSYSMTWLHCLCWCYTFFCVLNEDMCSR
jgi:hypothetical protein